MFTTDNTVPTDSNGKPLYRRYWPVPQLPSLNSPLYEYQDVGKDKSLRMDVTDFFQKKVVKWMDEYPEFKKHKSKKQFIQSHDGKIFIYNLLNKFIHNSNINWFDLRDNYSIIKQFISNNL
jgi:hypothetical protein